MSKLLTSNCSEDKMKPNKTEFPFFFKLKEVTLEKTWGNKSEIKSLVKEEI